MRALCYALLFACFTSLAGQSGGSSLLDRSSSYSFTVSSKQQSLINGRYVIFAGDVIARLNDMAQLTGKTITLDTATGAVRGSKVQYSGCCAEKPHWALTADAVRLKDNWLSASQVAFCVDGTSLLYLPWFSFPLHRQLQGNSFFPKISYDARHGLEVQQSLRYSFAAKSFVKGAVDWRSRKGAVWQAHAESVASTNCRGSLQAWHGTDAQDTAYWLKIDSMYKLPGNGPLVVGDWTGGNDARVMGNFFDDPHSHDEWLSNKVVAQWQSISRHVTGGVRQELGRRTRAPGALPTRGIAQHSQWRNQHETWYVPQITMQQVLPASWPVYGSVQVGGDWRLWRESNQSRLFPENYAWQEKGRFDSVGRLWAQADLRHTAVFSYGRVRGSIQPYVQCRTQTRDYVQGYAGVDAQLAVHGNGVTVGPFSWQPSVIWQGWQGEPHLQDTCVDEYDHVARAQVITAGSTMRWATGSLSLQQPLVLQGRDTVPYAMRIEGDSGLLPLQITSSYSKDSFTASSTHLFGWERSAWGMHRVDLALDAQPLAIDFSVAQYAPWYAQAKRLEYAGGAFVSCGIKWYPSRYLCWWLKSTFMYNPGDELMGISELSSWRGLHHDIGIEYTGHCWAVQAGYRQKAITDFGQDRTQYSYYLKLRFAPIGTFGMALKQWLYH